MISVGLHTIGIILDHKWHWINHYKKTNTKQQALSSLGPKIWTETIYSTKNEKTVASFTHAMKGQILSKLFR